MFNPNNPSYYRAHQYKNQFDLPTSAFKNRDLQSSPSAIPQGKQYFEQSNKKHFAHKFNRSEIQEDNVMHQYPEQQIRKSRIAFDPSYFRSLNVDDIQGTKPNTLISQALKNRQKAESFKKNQQDLIQNRRLIDNKSYVIQPRQAPTHYSNQPIGYNNSLVYKQTEAVNKFKKSKSIMQNNSSNVLNNFVSQQHNYKPVVHQKANHTKIDGKSQGYKYSNNFHFRDSIKPITSQEAYNFETLQTEQDEKIEKETKKPSLKEQRVCDIQTQLLSDMSYKHKNQRILERKYQQNQQNEWIQKQRPEFNGMKFEIKRQFEHQNKIVSERNKRQENYQKNKEPSHNEKSRLETDIHSDSLSSHKDQHFDPKKSLNIQSHKYYSNQIPNPIPIQKIDKSNVRRFNPTFLSFQSQNVARLNR